MRYVPIAVAALTILAAAVFNGVTTERWSGGVDARTLRLVHSIKELPVVIGPWEGVDSTVDKKIQRIAGIKGEGYVSRLYKHQDTGEMVNVWLIAGHGSQIVRHTPDVCYPSNNFKLVTKSSYHHEIKVDGEPPMECWTNVFFSDRSGAPVYQRVFWMWYDPRVEGPVQWQAPGHHVRDARYRFGGSKALFKLYFTTSLSPNNKDELPSENLANEFAQDFVPVLNKLLIDAKNSDEPLPGGDAESDDEANGERAAEAA